MNDTDQNDSNPPLDSQAASDPLTSTPDALSGDQDVHASTSDPIWMLPAIIIVAVIWFLVTVPGKIVPLTMIHFISMQAGPMIGALALGVWWMMSRRLPMKQRIVGLCLVVSTLVASVLLAEKSTAVVTIVYGIPIALTILVGLLLILRSSAWSVRRWIAYLGFALFLVGTLFFRVTEMDGSFAFRLAPRWASTDESRLLEELREQETGASDAAPSLVLPDQPGSGDWAEFRGPNRDSRVEDLALEIDWDANPPKEVWRRPVGPGWSSFCVVGPAIFTQEQRGDSEAVTAYLAASGTPLWTSESMGRFEASMGGVGPRATPTFNDGRLYVTTAGGTLRCLQASTGESLWEYDFAEELEVTIPEWGFASSPLVVDDLVVIFTGASDDRGLLALDKNTGQVRWNAGDGSHSYCSPQVSTIDGQRQILYATSNGLQSHQIDDGSRLWKHEWDLQGMPRVVQPAVVGNTIYLGTGYGNGTRRIDVHKQSESGDRETWDVQSDWTVSLKPYFNDAVYFDGHLYGFDSSILMSIDGETGDRNWKGGRYGHGQVILITQSKVLLILTEKGQLVLVRATPQEHDELASIDALEGVTWNHPVIAGGKLYLRNATEAVCYELPGMKLTSTPSTALVP